MARVGGRVVVEVSPSAEPPGWSVGVGGEDEARKKQKVIEVKEIKLRPNIDDNDYMVKMRSMRKFLEEGDKVKVTMRFRGREMAHQDIGLKVLDRVREELDELGKVEQFPRVEGRQMVMVLAPR